MRAQSLAVVLQEWSTAVDTKSLDGLLLTDDTNEEKQSEHTDMRDGKLK